MPNPTQPLVDFGRQFYARGWMEGTGGNLSIKHKENPLEILITPSGVNKGYMRVEDLITVKTNMDPGLQPAGMTKSASSPAVVSGGPTLTLKPSYETPIHLAIYKALPDVGAVFHVHPVYAVVLSSLFGHPEETRAFPIKWIEILKGIGFLEGQDAEFPVLANWQDVTRVGADITAYLGRTKKPAPGFILYNHGLTVWGQDVEEARNHLEVMEYVCKIIYKRRLLKD
jgi:methylthioribose-1-phosphate isomerase